MVFNIFIVFIKILDQNYMCLVLISKIDAVVFDADEFSMSSYSKSVFFVFRSAKDEVSWRRKSRIEIVF